MSNTRKCFRSLSLFLLSVLMLAGCQTQQPSSQSGRYFTWVDDQGRVRRSPIPEAQNPVEARAQKIREQRQNKTDTKGNNASATSSLSPGPTHNAQKTATTKKTTIAPAKARRVPGRSQPHKKPVSPAEKTKDGATDPEYNLKNYPDGDKLAAKGFVREGDPLPYFSWRDSQGHIRVSHYRPKGAAVDSGRTPKKVPRLTSALVLDGKRSETPEKMAPDVSSVMGLKTTNTIFQDWNARCCQDLPVRNSEQWDRSREFQIDMTSDTDRFAFSTGESVYQLIRLPTGKKAEAFVMRLRSYIHSGVFVPTLAFLDDRLNTRRLVTDLAFRFNPETWHSLGSFEATVPVFPGQGDRWLLIMSTKADQEGQTVVEKDGWPTAIPHQAHGTLGLTEVE